MKLLTPLFQSMCGFLYYTSKHCQSYKPRVVLHSKDNYLYVSRLCNMCKNKIIYSIILNINVEES